MAYLTTRQISAELGVCARTIRRMVARGELIPCRFNARVTKFREEDLRKFLDSKRGAA
jgi:excisionase family DNA binding protein